VLAQHCTELGTDFGAIVRSANFNVVIGESDKDVQDKLAWIRSHYEPLLPADALARTLTAFETGPLVGTPDQIVERLESSAGLGLAYAICYFVDAAYDRGSIELFEKQVVPAVSG
jgi:alkanesulfonate monooxygenase SsuD/methylene tetrahydromethanopterin reductase-like flavin-dependent oxidoreductase (luciferase family)